MPAKYWEHLDSQGDATSFFAVSTFVTFIAFLSLAAICALLCLAAIPLGWGDPSHRRAITQESLVFLSQEHIAANRKAKTTMSDFSDLWKLDFKIIRSTDNQRTHEFMPLHINDADQMYLNWAASMGYSGSNT